MHMSIGTTEAPRKSGCQRHRAAAAPTGTRSVDAVKNELPYGSWPSPLSARDVAAGSHPVETGRYVGDEIWWVERMLAERGRSAVRRAAASGAGPSAASVATRAAEPETLLPR